MNILPKKCAQFKSKDYWNNFFNQLKNTDQQNFQWYGNYKDFKQQLKKIFKHLLHKNTPQTSLSVFHIGCGKSTFGEDILFDYPQFNIINTDYSQEIVKDMIKRSLLMKTMCRYEVCDMFEQLNEKYRNKFDMVLDKGTLDAILPEDVSQQVQRIKEVFFRNVQLCLNPQHHSTYIIISMLQPFVLRTVLQHFYKKAQYEIQIQQSSIKDSKMQPFLIFIKRYPDSQPQTINKITLKLLKGNKQLLFQSPAQVMNKISTIQETLASQQQVKKLSPNRHLTYNIANPQQLDKMRYTIEIVDNQQTKLYANTCAVFIVPQGKENSYLFNNQKGLRKFIQQVGTSRLIVIKLLTGNVFKSIQQVKTQINPIIQNFIQQKCQVKNVPFMTDAEELGSRKIIFENQTLYVEEIGANQNEAYRRVIFKNNLGLIQTRSKLVYQNPENCPYAKDIQTKTKILTPKKGKYVVIDKSYIDEGYCQQIVAGLTKLCRSSQQTPKTLVLGAGGYSISKFLFENVSPHLQLVNVQKQKSLCEPELLSIFQVLHHSKSNDFQIINDDAYDYIVKQENKQQFSSIIVDIAGNNQKEQVPPQQFLSHEFIQKCSSLLDEKDGGVLIFNILRKGFVKNELPEISKLKLFDLVFVAQQQDEGDTVKGNKQEEDEEDCLVLFMMRVSEQRRSLLNNNVQKLVEYAEELLSTKQVAKSKGKKDKNALISFQLQISNSEWVQECTEQIKLVYPVNKSSLKI